MFCHNCGSKSLEGAVFCQKCGTKLLKDEAEPVSAAAQNSVSAPPNVPAPKSTAKICDLLKKGLSHCPKIKSVSPAKKSNAIIMKGRVYNYIANIANGQIVLMRTIAMPFVIPLAVIAGFLTWVVASIGWDFVDYGFDDSHTLPLAIGLLAMGLFLAAITFLGERETGIVLPYIRKAIEPGELLVPTGKKQKRSYIITLTAMLAIALTGIVLLIFAAADNFDFGKSDASYAAADDSALDTAESISLSQTYINDEEGFSFKYPSTWQHLSESDFEVRKDMVGNYDLILVIYTLDDLGYEMDYYASYMQVLKGPVNLTFQGTKDDFQNSLSLTMDEVEVTGLSDIDLNGIPARKLSYLFNDNGQTCVVTEYYYIIADDMYGISFYASQENFDKHEPVFNAIMDSYTITAADTPEDSITENSFADSQSIQWKAAYSNKVRELAAEAFTPQFALINLNDDDIPELVADYSGYGVSVFTWADETLVVIMEDWPYGAMGNHGYEYLPGENVIRNYNSDQAGAIVYESYMKVNDACELVAIYDQTLSYWFFEDTNGNGIMDENEPSCDEPYYYYGNTEITAEKYASYQIPGNYESITGDKPAEAILSQLNDENRTNSIISEMFDKGAAITTTSEISAHDLIGEFGYDASFTDSAGGWNNFYYSLEIGWIDSELVITSMWRGIFIFDHERVSPENLTGNTLVFSSTPEPGLAAEAHSLTYIPAKDSPLGKDTIYIDGDETMPYVRE